MNTNAEHMEEKDYVLKIIDLQDEIRNTLLYLLEWQDKALVAQSALLLIAAGPRDDGTYNRDRKACEILAKETLKKIREAGK